MATTNKNSITLPIAFKNSYSATVIPAMGESYDPGVYRLLGVVRLNILDFYVSKGASTTGGVQCIWIAVGY